MPSTEYFTTFKTDHGFFRIVNGLNRFVLEFVDHSEHIFQPREYPSLQAAKNAIRDQKTGAPAWDQLDRDEGLEVFDETHRWTRHPIHHSGPTCE